MVNDSVQHKQKKIKLQVVYDFLVVCPNRRVHRLEEERRGARRGRRTSGSRVSQARIKVSSRGSPDFRVACSAQQKE